MVTNCSLPIFLCFQQAQPPRDVLPFASPPATLGAPVSRNKTRAYNGGLVVGGGWSRAGLDPMIGGERPVQVSQNRCRGARAMPMR